MLQLVLWWKHRFQTFASSAYHWAELCCCSEIPICSDSYTGSDFFQPASLWEFWRVGCYTAVNNVHGPRDVQEAPVSTWAWIVSSAGVVMMLLEFHRLQPLPRFLWAHDLTSNKTWGPGFVWPQLNTEPFISTTAGGEISTQFVIALRHQSWVLELTILFYIPAGNTGVLDVTRQLINTYRKH